MLGAFENILAISISSFENYSVHWLLYWLAALFPWWLVFAVLSIVYKKFLISSIPGQGSSLSWRLPVHSAVSFVLVAMQTLSHLMSSDLLVLGTPPMLLGSYSESSCHSQYSKVFSLCCLLAFLACQLLKTWKLQDKAVVPCHESFSYQKKRLHSCTELLFI